MYVDYVKPQREHWVEVMSADDFVQDVGIMHRSVVDRDKLVIVYHIEGVSHIHVYRLTQGKAVFLKDVNMPEEGYIPSGKEHGSEESKYYCFQLTKHFTPANIYKLNMDTLQVEPFYIAPKPEVDVSDLRADYVYVTSKDGTKVPITILRNIKSLPSLDAKPKEPLPSILYAYGGYGNVEYPKGAEPLMWVKNFRGIYVTVHVRGGGERGLFWHAGGHGKNRTNSFDDIIAAAEFLQAKGYTSASRTAIQGGSNGGFVMAGTLNQRPDVFGAAFIEVAISDLMRYHRFTGSVSWLHEKGFSGEDENVRWMLHQSPLHSIKNMKYPPVVISTADNDDRVSPLHSFKYAAELQYKVGGIEGSGPIVLNVRKNDGHSGGGISVHTVFNLLTQMWNLTWY